MARSSNALKPRVRSQRRRSTREQILDSAEELFSRYGFQDVMLRDVTDHVGVDPTLLHYYFKDKDDLFNEVLAARVQATSSNRLAALNAYERSANGKPTVVGVLRAYLVTDTDSRGAEGKPFHHYGNLGAQMRRAPDCRSESIDSEFDPVVERLIALLSLALPDCPREDILWGFHFVSGALMLTLARSDRIDKLSGTACATSDVSAAKERLANFMAGGFKRMFEMRVQERAAAERLQHLVD